MLLLAVLACGPSLADLGSAVFTAEVNEDGERGFAVTFANPPTTRNSCDVFSSIRYGVDDTELGTGLGWRDAYVAFDAAAAGFDAQGGECSSGVGDTIDPLTPLDDTTTFWMAFGDERYEARLRDVGLWRALHAESEPADFVNHDEVRFTPVVAEPFTDVVTDFRLAAPRPGDPTGIVLDTATDGSDLLVSVDDSVDLPRCDGDCPLEVKLTLQEVIALDVEACEGFAACDATALAAYSGGAYWDR